jgi:hypothetical protein
MLGRSQAEVEILEIEKVPRIESAEPFKHGGAKEHEATADDRRVP